MKLTEAQRKKRRSKFENCIKRTLVEHRSYHLEYLKEQNPPDSILVIMEEAAVAAGIAALKGE